MRIPQVNNNNISAAVPTVQPARIAVPQQNNSYAETINALGESLNNLGELQSKLSTAQTDLNIRRFNAYASTATEKYLSQISTAQNSEEMSQLKTEFKKNINDEGIKQLGAQMYNGWYRNEGGKLFANAEYKTQIADTQLKIDKAKTDLNDYLQWCNVNAFTSDSQGRKNFQNLAYNAIDSGVKNKLFNEAESQELKRNFDYTMQTSLVQQDIKTNPWKTSNELKTNAKYMPLLNSTDRTKFIDEADRLYAAQVGTGKSDVVSSFLDNYILPVLSQETRMLPNGKVISSLEFVNDLKNRFSDPTKLNSIRKLVTPFSKNGKVSFQDLMSIKNSLEGLYDNENSPQYKADSQAYSDFQEQQNIALSYQNKKDKKYSIASSSPEDAVLQFENGQLDKLQSVAQVQGLLSRIGELNKSVTLTDTQQKDLSNQQDILYSILAADVSRGALRADKWYSNMRKGLSFLFTKTQGNPYYNSSTLQRGIMRDFLNSGLPLDVIFGKKNNLNAEQLKALQLKAVRFIQDNVESWHINVDTNVEKSRDIPKIFPELGFNKAKEIPSYSEYMRDLALSGL